MCPEETKAKVEEKATELAKQLAVQNSEERAELSKITTFEAKNAPVFV